MTIISRLTDMARSPGDPQVLSKGRNVRALPTGSPVRSVGSRSRLG
jgi:hypothetical protein